MASFYGRTLRTGSFIRYAAEQYRYEDEYVCYEVGVRGKLRDRARELGDPDIGDFRADNTCGWKARKHRHQWEHRVLAAEKREKNRRRKAARKAEKAERKGKSKGKSFKSVPALARRRENGGMQ